eukprot:TRINITY_DN10345_c0_g1_i1.p1 TRINITY_DN10345_c0_g1~~TRINITY_DN10345_c0_g1_i1.p1  ORF type:complete len:129 (+),score=53.35 TRINITY_DN10345_c0_g1_i1:94-480(+)
MLRCLPRSTQSRSSAASDVYKRQEHLGIEAFDRGRFRDIERLTLGDALNDIEEHHVAEFLQTGEQRQRATDIPSADQRDFVASHLVPHSSDSGQIRRPGGGRSLRWRCLLYTSPSPRDRTRSRMPSSA